MNGYFRGLPDAASKTGIMAGSSSRGMALVVALSLVAFILLLCVSLTTLVQLEIQSGTQSLAQVRARENAHLGLMQALSQLQQHAGPDRRVTARADINPLASPVSRYWTGVWESQPGQLVELQANNNHEKPPTGPFQRWLVSLGDANGNVDDATAQSEAWVTDINPLTPESVWKTVRLVGGGSAAVGSEVDAGLVAIRNGGGHIIGGYGWWVGDEGIKAKINIHDARAEAAVGSADWFNRYRAAPRFGIEEMHADAEETEAVGDLQAFTDGSMEKLVWLSDLSVPQGDTDAFLKQRYHDLTTHSFGLPVDVRVGELRRDLTAAFANNDVFEHAFPPGSKTFEFRDDPVFDSFLDSFAYEYNGPNWGILKSYYRHYRPENQELGDLGWRQVEGVRKLPALMHSPAETEAQPFRARRMPDPGDAQDFGLGVYQTVSPIFAIDARKQLSLRMSFIDLADHGHPEETTAEGHTRTYKKPMIHVTPTLVLYNPYNVFLELPGLNTTAERIEFGLNPLIEIKVGDNAPVAFHLNEILPPDFTGNLGWISGFRLRTQLPGMVFEPGESLIFGLDEEGYMFDNPDTHVFGDEWYLRSPGMLMMKNDTELMYSFKLPTNADYILTPTDANEGPDDRVNWTGVQPRPVYPRSGSSPNFPRWGLSESERARLRIVEVRDVDGNLVPDESSVSVSVRITFSRFYTSWHRGSDSRNVPGRSLRLAIQRYGEEMGLTRYGIEPEGREWEDFDHYAGVEAKPALAVWRYGLRTINEGIDNAVRFIDANFRPFNLYPEASGGWEANALDASLPMSNYGHAYGRMNLVDEIPVINGSWDEGRQRYSAFWGADIDGVTPGVGNRTHVVMFDVPREPLLSIGALQHANLGRYGFHPNYIVGQSYAPPLIEPAQAWRNYRFPRSSGDTTVGIYLDLPYLLNSILWDRYFFSSIPQNLDQAALDTLLTGNDDLPNSRHVILPSHGLTPEMLRYDEDGDPETAFATVAGHLLVNGAFNVNSTSVQAWRALLSSSRNLELPVYGLTAQSPDHTHTNTGRGPLFPRFSRSFGGENELFAGSRRLTLEQVDELAQAIVDEVRQRGPFGSLADFVNRSLGNPREAHHQQSGALQAAIDNTSINARAETMSGASPLATYGTPYGPTPPGPQAAGLSGYLLQSDILQLLGPVLSARSDTFVIRAYGETRNPLTGSVEARAWCEAVAQRLPEPFQSSAGGNANDALISPPGEFGRRFKIVAFRWLDENDI